MAGPVLRNVTGAEDRRPVDPRPTPLDRDRPLVEASRRDPAAFDALYRRYLAQVYSFAYYELGDHHAAEDATSRTFLQALAALPRFRERADPAEPEASTFRVWLFQIARNVVSNERRAMRRHPTLPIEAAAVVADTVDVEGDAVTRDEVRAAWSAVGRLPEDRRQAVLLRLVGEMSAAEVAGVLGRTEGAVRVLVHRALRSVAAELHRRGGDSDRPTAGKR